MKERKDSCVELNIYVECDKCSGSGPRSLGETADKKDDDDDTCVRINLFVDCDSKKCKYTL